MKALRKLTNGLRRNPGIVWAVVAVLVALMVWRFVSANGDDAEESVESCKDKKGKDGKPKYYDPARGKCMESANCKGVIRGGLCDGDGALGNLAKSIECKKNRDKWWDPEQQKCRWADQCKGTVSSAGLCVTSSGGKGWTSGGGGGGVAAATVSKKNKGGVPAPVPPTTGGGGGNAIILYTGNNFTNSNRDFNARTVEGGVQKARNLGSLADVVKGIYIPKGRSVRLYDNDNGTGAYLDLNSDNTLGGKNVDLAKFGWANRAASIMSWWPDATPPKPAKPTLQGSYDRSGRRV